jgi:alpha-D-ribose 1-methylphosphonate 5-triphosphate synthase subunit PhnH
MKAFANIFSGGFDEPVFQSQETFRALMNAMAMPGTVSHIVRPAVAPTTLNRASASLLLTLCDYEAPVFLSLSLTGADMADWISFHSGSTVTNEAAAARFAFVAKSDELPNFGDFAQGTEEYPDRSATIVLQVSALDNGKALELTGPGIKGRTVMSAQGLPAGFISAWAANGALYPRGIDLVITCGAQFTCLPRTVKIREI